MYNGIGLQTARGSGTNGYVQRNLAVVRKTKAKVEYSKEDDERKDQSHKQPNKEILDHMRKRKIEVKCVELMDVLEEQGFTQEEIDDKVNSYRQLLLGEEKKLEVPLDENGRVNAKDTHQMAEAQQEKNSRLREAFGISKFFVEGSSLDPERRHKEAEARAAENKKYELVRTPSPEPQPQVEKKRKKEKKRSPSKERKSHKKKKSKRH